MSGRILKKITITVITAGMTLNVYAVDPGFYMGLMLGPATHNGGNITVQTDSSVPGIPPTTTATPKKNQFGSRFYLGYQVTKYAGFEGGLDYFTGISYTTELPTCSSVQVRNRGFDFVGKGSLPFAGFTVFGKLGAALIYQTTSGAINADSSLECGKSTYVTKVRPTASIGASYDLTQNWVADVTWNRLMVGGPVSSVDYFAFGISYHFVNKYCGQFLCDD